MSETSESQPILFNFEDLESQAEKYLDSVREKARTIIAEALQQAQAQAGTILKEANEIKESARKEGYQTGFKSGQTDGLKLAKDEIQKGIQDGIEKNVQVSEQTLLTLLKALRQEKSRFVETWEADLVGLIAAATRQIVRQELKSTPEITLNWVREALDLCSGGKKLVLHLHPEDVTCLKIPLRNIQTEFARVGKIEVKPDSTLQRGDCFLETEYGQLDQRLDVQLGRLREELSR